MIRTIKVYSFECDWLGCDQAAEYQDQRIADAIRQAEADSWIVANGLAFCPDHAGRKR